MLLQKLAGAFMDLGECVNLDSFVIPGGQFGGIGTIDGYQLLRGAYGNSSPKNIATRSLRASSTMTKVVKRKYSW